MMKKITRNAALTLLCSTALFLGGAAVRADQGGPTTNAAATGAGAIHSVAQAKPEAGGRVIAQAQAAANGSTWSGSSTQAKPEAGGRVMIQTRLAADAGPAWPGSSAQAKPEAGGRVIAMTEMVGENGPTPQRTSAVACSTEANATDRC